MGELGNKMGDLGNKTKEIGGGSVRRVKAATKHASGNNRDPIHFEPNNISFGVYSKEEILKLSTVEIFNPSTFSALGHPNENGLHDLRMGPYDLYGQVKLFS